LAHAITNLHVGLSEIDVKVGDLESARRHLEAAAASGERAGLNEGRYRWFVAMGLLAHADGEPDEAVKSLDRAAELYRPGFFPDVRPIAAIKARIWIAHGNLSEAADWARDRGASVTDDASYLSEFDHLTLVRLILAQHGNQDSGALAQAASLLGRLLAAAETSGRAGSSVEIRLLTALVQDAQGRRAQAQESLAQALARAPEPEGYVRLFLDEDTLMLSLLRNAIQHGVAGDADYQRVASDRARRLLSLAAAPAAGAPHPGQRRAAPSAEPLSDRELQVLRLLDSELTGPQIARELFVSHNTVRTHTKHIFTKLDVTNRRAAVLRARERGLL
jgi:LuxR family maltose regulon positive regulatory protein